MNKIIRELLENGISVTMEYDEEIKNIEYVLTGFYKSGQVRLIETDDKLVAHARYNEKTNIESLYDIVNLNYTWWQSSKNRLGDWVTPETDWIPLLEKFNLITKEVKIVTTYK